MTDFSFEAQKPLIHTSDWKDLERIRKKSGTEKEAFYRDTHRRFYPHVEWKRFWFEAERAGVWPSMKNLDGSPIYPRDPAIEPKTGLGKAADWLFRNRIISPGAGYVHPSGAKEPPMMTGVPGLGLMGPAGITPGGSLLATAAKAAGNTALRGAANVINPHGAVARTAKHIFGTTARPGARAREVLSKAAGSRVNVDPVPIGGMRTTLGQRANSDSIMALEGALRTKPQFVDTFRAADDATRGAIQRRFDQVRGVVGTPDDAAIPFAQSLRGAKGAVKDVAKKRWDRFDAQGGRVNPAAVTSTYEKYVAGLPAGHKPHIPSWVKTQLAESKTARDYQSIVSSLRGAAADTKDPVRQKVLGDMATAIDDSFAAATTGASRSTIESARRATRVEKTIFEGRKGKAASPFRDPMLNKMESKVAPEFFKTGRGSGAVERAAAINRAAKYNPQLRKDAQYYLVSRYFDDVLKEGRPGMGFSPAKSRDFIKNHEPYIKANLSPTQRALLNRVNRALAQWERRPIVRGSNTADKLAADNYLLEGIVGWTAGLTQRIPLAGRGSDLLFKAGRERVQAAIVRAVVENPKAAALFLKKNDPKRMMEVIDVLTPYLVTRAAGEKATEDQKAEAAKSAFKPR